MEMRTKHLNHARNIFGRCIAILPRVMQFWLKYTYMEELVFEWVEWKPTEQAWNTYINFGSRYKEIDPARSIYQRFLRVHGTDPTNWINYARFEERHGFYGKARAAYERAMEYFGKDNIDEHLLVSFVLFEERQKEHERARIIYKYGLDRLPAEKQKEIYEYYTQHEKKLGELRGIEGVILSKRKAQYEEQVQENGYNYDAWFDYLRLLENEGADRETVEDAYEQAIANLPPRKRPLETIHTSLNQLCSVVFL